LCLIFAVLRWDIITNEEFVLREMDHLSDPARGLNMTYLKTIQDSFVAWMNGLSAADSALIAALGIGLMIFAVAALLVQKHFEKKSIKPKVTQRPHASLPGIRHSVAHAVPMKTGMFARKTKVDPFLSRLDRLA
jgi:hypothetical protein